jgi:hypothetical protein
MNPTMDGVLMYGGVPVYPKGVSTMYGSGAIPPINRGHGGFNRMYGGVPIYIPPTLYRYDQSVPTMYGNHRLPPRAYENGWLAPSYRNAAGSSMRGSGAKTYGGGYAYSNDQLRGVGGKSDIYGGNGVLDDDIDEGAPPLMHSGLPDLTPDGEVDDGHCGGKFVCKVGEFSCLGSCTCIRASWRCDGDADCAEGEDEAECGDDPEKDLDEDCNVNDGNVRCPRTGKCIRDEWLCDGDDDCGDFSDETHCGKYER